jgi:hypothetical protein
LLIFLLFLQTKPSFVVCLLVMGSLKKNTTLEYSTRVVQEGDRRCEKSTLNDLAYLTPLRIPLMNPVLVSVLDCSVIPVSISTVSLGKLSTYILLDFKVGKWAASSPTNSSNPF